MMKTAKKLHKENNFSMLHCRSYVSAEVGLFFQKKLGVPFLFDMRGFWADEKVDSRQWDLKKWWFRKIFNHYKKLEKQFVIQSKYIICLTNAGKKELFKLYEHELHNLSQSINQKCIVIPCCADLDLFDYNAINEEEKLKVKRQLSIKEKQTVISYSGSLGGWYMLDEMLDFFKTFKSEFTDAVFLCLTRDKHFVEKAIVEKKIDSNDIITLFAQKKELPLYLSLSFFSIFFIKPTYSKIASSPTKHAELMGLGIPVICNDIGDTGEIVITNKLGFLVKPGDKESYETAIKKMKDENFNKENIRNTGIAIFDVTKGVDLYAQVYQQIFDI